MIEVREFDWKQPDSECALLTEIPEPATRPFGWNVEDIAMMKQLDYIIAADGTALVHSRLNLRKAHCCLSVN